MGSAVFCRNLHDPSLSVSVQCTSVRLLLNLVEVVFSRRADHRVAEAYRGMLAGILDAFTSKQATLHRKLPQLLQFCELVFRYELPPCSTTICRVFLQRCQLWAFSMQL